MRIAIVGAGPIGIEAAVALQQAGHQVVVYEAGPEPAWSTARWSHVTLFTPWSMNTTAAGRQLLGDPDLLRSGDFPTGGEFREHYLLPLARSLDLRTGHRVVGVARQTLTKGQELGSAERSREPFRLLLRTDQGEFSAQADVVLDCSGTFEDPSPAGPGGLHVPGEEAAAEAGRLHHGPCEVGEVAGQRVIVVGDGATATTLVLDLLDGGAQVSWFTPSAQVPGFHSPEADVLPGRRGLWLRGRAAVEVVDHRPGAWIRRVDLALEGLRVLLESGEELVADQIFVATGFRPDNRLLRELQFHACWGSEGPMKLSASLLASRGDGGGDCMAASDQGGPDVLRSPEPRLFVLGSKSFGRRSDFLLQTGHQQVRDVLELIAMDAQRSS